ncbi:MAG: bifunctional nuclease family protein, partial [Actinobacteria bacterium]|nr:bifunctional nuclease family protein [Actinomycetota bacterium]
GLRQMVIYDVRMDEEANAFVLILVDVESKVFLPIWIGHFEATSILFELREVRPERPFTHDLLKNIIQALGGKPQRVVISEIKDRTFYALIDIKSGSKLLRIDSRPSDAVALAVRSRIPIFAEASVLIEAGIFLDQIAQGEDEEQKEIFDSELNKKIEEFRQFLDRVKPEDFQD